MNRYRIEKTGRGDYRVFVGNAMSAPAIQAKREHLHRMGWDDNQILRELDAETQEADVTGADGMPYGISADFVLSNITPGDIILTPNMGFLVQDQAYA